MSKIFKDTRMMSGVSTINFEHILNYILLLILLNSNRWMLAGHEERQFQKILFSATSRNMLRYWEGKICWAISFNVYSHNLSFLKDKLSWQHFKVEPWFYIANIIFINTALKSFPLLTNNNFSKCYLRHTLIFFLIQRKVMFRSQDIQVFAS